MKNSTIQSKYKNLLSIFFWIGLWGLVALGVDNKVLVPLPHQVAQDLVGLVASRGYWISILNSLLKISLGLALGFFLGLGLGILSFKYPLMEQIIKLPMDLVKSTPVASITIILLVWIKSTQLSLFIVLLIVLPHIYYSTISGLKDVDRKLLDMAQVFKVARLKQVKYIYLPRLKEFLIPSLMVTSGLAWKSGISGEVLGLVNNSIGENIYYSKLYLNTSELFAWTLTIVLISHIFELLITRFLKRVV